MPEMTEHDESDGDPIGWTIIATGDDGSVLCESPTKNRRRYWFDGKPRVEPMPDPARCPLCGCCSEGATCCLNCGTFRKRWPAVQALKDERDEQKKGNSTLRENLLICDRERKALREESAKWKAAYDETALCYGRELDKQSQPPASGRLETEGESNCRESDIDYILTWIDQVGECPQLRGKLPENIIGLARRALNNKPERADDGEAVTVTRFPIALHQDKFRRIIWASDSNGSIKIDADDGYVKEVVATNKHDWSGHIEIKASEAFATLQDWGFDAGANALNDFYQFDDPTERRPLGVSLGGGCDA